MELEFLNELNEKEYNEKKINMSIDNDIPNNGDLKVKRSESFNCDISIHIFNPYKSPPSNEKFLEKGLKRLINY